MTQNESRITPCKVNPVTRVILMIVGTISLGLALLGALLPVLPATPFVFLSAACYLRSSERLHAWVINHPLLGPFLYRFHHERSMTLRAKLSILVLAWTMLMATAIFAVENEVIKIILVVVAVIKTIVFARIKTAKG